MIDTRTIKHKPNILVIGDFILDQYYWTEVERISPEAPVPVCRIQSTTHRLGGAGNVAHNLVSFGSNVSVMGIIGNDTNAQIMTELFNDLGINCNNLQKSKEFSTISKSRVLAKNQQICRLDHEEFVNKSANDDEQILNTIKSSISEFDAVVISDYNKGMLTLSLANEIIKIANSHNIPAIVDPNGHSIEKYKGAAFITPNMNEFKAMTGIASNMSEDTIISEAQKLIVQNQISTMVLTRSEKGMTVINKTDFNHYPTKVVEVSDVTGAGDTVVAAIAFGESLKFDFSETANFANSAAAIVVSKLGTATATIKEIESFESDPKFIAKKHHKAQEVANI